MSDPFKECAMRYAIVIAVALVGTITAGAVLAQSDAGDATRTQKSAEAREVARNPVAAEGDPLPEPKARVPKDTRRAAKAARKVDGAAESHSSHRGEGEGDPVPPAARKVSRAERLQAESQRKQE